MKNTFLLFLGFFMCNNLSAKNIVIDKGSVQLVFSEIDNRFDWSYSLPQNCSATKVIESEDDTTLYLKHTGEKCSEGAKILIQIGKNHAKNKLNIKVSSGTITLPKNLKYYNSIKAKVASGVVSSYLINTKRDSINPASMSGSFESKNKSIKKFDVAVSVMAGVVIL